MPQQLLLSVDKRFITLAIGAAALRSAQGRRTKMHWVATLLMSIIYVSLFLCCGLTFYLFGWTWLYDLYCCRRIDVAHDRIDPLTNILFMRYGDHKYLHPVPRRLGDLDFGPDEIIIRIPRPVPRYLPSMPRC